MDAVGWLVEGERRGAGEFVLNSMDADGTESGYDLDLISTVAEKTTLPIVASGGAGGPEHMISAVTLAPVPCSRRASSTSASTASPG